LALAVLLFLDWDKHSSLLKSGHNVEGKTS
jgi:hypothetical protein